ncbi:hypothetical protein MRX96_026947 [Rhipicephalus microplus]
MPRRSGDHVPSQVVLAAIKAAERLEFELLVSPRSPRSYAAKSISCCAPPSTSSPRWPGRFYSSPLDLYLRMRQEGGNVLLSPWHLACMLVVMYHGSGGDTRQQIARVLCTDDDGEIVSRFDCHASHLLCRDYRKARHTHSADISWLLQYTFALKRYNEQ